MQCFIQANNTSFYIDVIELGKQQESHEKLVEFLQLARKTYKESVIDNELVFCFSQSNDQQSLQELIQKPNNAELPKVAERLYQEGYFESALSIFINLKNNSKICSCLLYLGHADQAMEYAKKANNARTWKELMIFSLELFDSKGAVFAAQNIITTPDHLEDIVEHFEVSGNHESLIQLLESTIA